MNNIIIGVPEENGEGFKSIMLSWYIMEKDETSESQYQAVVETFSVDRDLIIVWSEIIEHKYPGQE